MYFFFYVQLDNKKLDQLIKGKGHDPAVTVHHTFCCILFFFLVIIYDVGKKYINNKAYRQKCCQNHEVMIIDMSSIV
jgi:hypothetical protein